MEAVVGPARPGRLVDAVRGHAFVPEHVLVEASPTLLVDTSAAVPDMLASIAGARRSIEVGEYILQPSGDGRRLLEALRARATGSDGQPPIEVSVLVDRQGSAQFLGTPQFRFFEELERDGVRIARHRGPLNPFAGGVDHRKLFVIDGTRTYVGGMGFSGSTSWHDVMVRMDGPVAAQAHAEFVGSWVDAGRKVSRLQLALLQEADTAGQHPVAVGARLVGNRPGQRLSATEGTLAMAHAAQQRLWVHTPYFGSPAMADALAGAARLGADARLAVNGNNSHFPVFPLLSRSFYRQLAAGGEDGVRLLEQAQMSHQKLVLADDWISAGSMNIAPRALDGDIELNVLSNHPGLRAQVEAMMLADDARAHVVASKDLESLSVRLANTEIGRAAIRRTIGSLA